jgi:hypothetical protein
MLATGCGTTDGKVEPFSHGGGGGGGGPSMECYSYLSIATGSPNNPHAVDQGVYFPTLSRNRDDVWRELGKSGPVIVTQVVDVVDIVTGQPPPLQPATPVWVTMGWDDQFTTPQWFRSSESASDADYYKSLSNTLQLSSPIPDVAGVVVRVEAPVTEYVCFPPGSVESWRQQCQAPMCTGTCARLDPCKPNAAPIICNGTCPRFEQCVDGVCLPIT